MSQMLNMRYSKELLARIDKYKDEMGFTTRTNTIIHLLVVALESRGY